MRSIPLDSAADSLTFKLKFWLSEPNTRPRAPPTPVPAVAGKLTAKFGLVALPPVANRDAGFVDRRPTLPVLPTKRAPPAAEKSPR